MISMKTFTFILSILSSMYAIPYANWEWKNKNKKGGFIVYVIAMLSLILSATKIFV